MEALLLTHDAALRGYALYVIGTMALLWESLFPAAAQVEHFLRRWVCNIGLLILNVTLTRLLVPITTVSVALSATEQGWGLFNQAALPGWGVALLAFLLLDLSAYLLHFAMHRVRWLWRVHALHHSDKDFDCTTGLRFHPLETLLAILFRASVVLALGIPAYLVVLYEVWAILAAFYTHLNTRIPERVEKPLRRLFITAGIHRIHHSALPDYSQCNFGIILSVWDKLFKTYRCPVAERLESMPVGIPWFNQQKSWGLIKLLALPFLSAPFVRDNQAR